MTPENVREVSRNLFQTASFSQCAGARTLNVFLHSFEDELMPRKYILLLSQHMKLLDNTFDETHLFVKRKFSEMMEGLS